MQGPGKPPNLGFACCEHGAGAALAMFANPDVITSLKDLHAEVAVAIPDFSAERSAVVRLLNREGIPVIAWMMLSKEDGFYMNADNEPEAATRIAEFERWTADENLRWAAVGLDIEPNLAELAELKTHRWRLMTTLLDRATHGQRIERAQRAYSELIREIQSRGYRIETYQMPYVPAEREAHSSFLDRMLGTVDVHGDEDYLMLYTSFARPVGGGMIWSLGRNAGGIAIGSTDGDTIAGSGAGPLSWEEFSRDLIVASHFSPRVGVYNLEGCVRQGFLTRMKSFNWSQAVDIPSASATRARRFGLALRAALWIADRIVYFISAAAVLSAWIIWRWLVRRKTVVA